jgi:hypothetical protein
MTIERIVVGVLAVWRVTHLLHAEAGPANLLSHLRRATGTGLVAELFDCFYCLSLWVALPAAVLLGSDRRERLLLWLGLSGGAILCERVTSPTASFVEDPEVEKSDAMLWNAEAGGDGGGGPPAGRSDS